MVSCYRILAPPVTGWDSTAKENIAHKFWIVRKNFELKWYGYYLSENLLKHEDGEKRLTISIKKCIIKKIDNIDSKTRNI